MKESKCLISEFNDIQSLTIQQVSILWNISASPLYHMEVSHLERLFVFDELIPGQRDKYIKQINAQSRPNETIIHKHQNRPPVCVRWTDATTNTNQALAWVELNDDDNSYQRPSNVRRRRCCSTLLGQRPFRGEKMNNLIQTACSLVYEYISGWNWTRNQQF